MLSCLNEQEPDYGCKTKKRNKVFRIARHCTKINNYLFSFTHNVRSIFIYVNNYLFKAVQSDETIQFSKPDQFSRFNISNLDTHSFIKHFFGNIESIYMLLQKSMVSVFGVLSKIYFACLHFKYLNGQPFKIKVTSN